MGVPRDVFPALLVQSLVRAKFNRQITDLLAIARKVIAVGTPSCLSKAGRLQQARHQARSWCCWMQCDFFMVMDGQATHVYRLGRGGSDAIEPLVECSARPRESLP